MHFLGMQNSFLFRTEEVADRESESKDPHEVQDDDEQASRGEPGPYNGESKLCPGVSLLVLPEAPCGVLVDMLSYTKTDIMTHSKK